MPAINLTEGAMAILADGEVQLTEIKPVLQVSEVRLVNCISGERYRILLSDGSLYQQAILATQQNELVRTEKLQKGSIIRLTEFVCDTIGNRRIVIVIRLDVILDKCDPIGHPKHYGPPRTDRKGLAVPGSPVLVQPMNQPANPTVTPSASQEMPPINLTRGAITMLANGEVQATEIKPVLQVSEIRLVNTQQNSSERYRILLSDGSLFQQAMLAPQNNELVRRGKLQRGSIIRLTEFFCDTIQTKMIVIIIQLDVILYKCDPIGDPKHYGSLRTDGEGLATPRSPAFVQPVRPYPNQYGGSTLASSSMTSMYATCNSCGGTGYTTVNCPSVSSFGNREIPVISGGGERFKRQRTDQWARDCRSMSNDPPAYLGKTVAQVKDKRLGTSEKPDLITVSATLSFIKADNFCYTACPLKNGDRQCNKMVTCKGDGKWHCDKCDKLVDECDYRYILQLQIQDHTGLTWVTAFQECGEEIMGISARDLYYLKYEVQDDEKFAQVLHSVLFTRYIFKLEVKEAIFSDEQRLKSTVVKAERVNFLTETPYLLDSIAKFKGEDSGFLPPIPRSGNVSSTTGFNGSGFGTGFRGPTAPTANYNGNTSNLSKETGLSANPPLPYSNQYGGPTLASSGMTAMHANCNCCGGFGRTSLNCPSVSSFGNRETQTLAMSRGGECSKCPTTSSWWSKWWWWLW